MYDIIVIGAGPAGMTAAIYARRAAKTVLVLEAVTFGGQIINTPDIENYPVEAHISGFDFSNKVYEQAKGLGAEFVFEKAVEIRPGDGFKTVVTPKNSYQGRAVILATGSENRKLGLEDEQRLTGKGVSYCATCDGNFYRNKVVAVVGGGNTALEDALYLADLAKQVYLIHRRDAFRGDDTNAARLKTEDRYDQALVCECEEVTAGEIESAIERLDITTLTDLRRRTRLGMGTCQGQLCTCRAAHLLAVARGCAQKEREDMRDFLSERWKGCLPIGWGDTLREAEYTQWVYKHVLGL